MNFELHKDVDLASLTTFKIGGITKYFVEIFNENELSEVFDWIKSNDLPYFILGSGSNTVFGDETFPGVVIKINIMGFDITQENNDFAIIKVGSGEDWDKLVERTVMMQLSGIEALSGIPSSTGAAPVQNIGAYGQEVKDTIDSVVVYDTHKNKVTSLANKECDFNYRDSIFKSSQKGRYIICYVLFKLSKHQPSIPKYKDVINYFHDRQIKNPTLAQIRDAIIEIRKKKFVNPSIMPNAGSFFKNPVVSKKIAEKIMLKYPKIKPYPEDTKIFPNPDGTYKIAAGWLIQEAGLKGIELDKVRIDPSHALVIENKGGASQKDLMQLVDKIRKRVYDLYEIELEIEPIIV